jgi:uncharacterized protein (TIGR02996 family)
MTDEAGADRARLEKHLDESPHDLVCRLVLADLLEEQGELERARCQRWLARHRKWPDPDLRPLKMVGWHWWGRADGPQQAREHAVLPPEVQKHMPAGQWFYPTRARAEAALAEALARLGETAG